MTVNGRGKYGESEQLSEHVDSLVEVGSACVVNGVDMNAVDERLLGLGMNEIGKISSRIYSFVSYISIKYTTED